MPKSASRGRPNKALVDCLKDAIASLREARKIAAQLYGVRMPIEPDIIRINRYVTMAKKRDAVGLGRRPASPARLAAAVENAKKAKGVAKGSSSAENLRRWRKRMYPSGADDMGDLPEA